jgi:hypothetical protein
VLFPETKIIYIPQKMSQNGSASNMVTIKTIHQTVLYNSLSLYRIQKVRLEVHHLGSHLNDLTNFVQTKVPVNYFECLADVTIIHSFPFSIYSSILYIHIYIIVPPQPSRLDQFTPSKPSITKPTLESLIPSSSIDDRYAEFDREYNNLARRNNLPLRDGLTLGFIHKKARYTLDDDRLSTFSYHSGTNYSRLTFVTPAPTATVRINDDRDEVMSYATQDILIDEGGSPVLDTQQILDLRRRQQAEQVEEVPTTQEEQIDLTKQEEERYIDIPSVHSGRQDFISNAYGVEEVLDLDNYSVKSYDYHVKKEPVHIKLDEVKDIQLISKDKGKGNVDEEGGEEGGGDIASFGDDLDWGDDPIDYGGFNDDDINDLHLEE